MRTLGDPTSLRVSDHACVACTTREDELAALIPFFREGLELGERCIYITDDAAASQQALAGIDTPRNALTVLARSEVFATGGFDPERVLDWVGRRTADALQEGYASLRLATDAVCIASDPKAARFAEYEARLNHLIAASRRMAILCVYDRTRIAAPLVRDMLATHPLVVIRNTVCKNPHYIEPDDFLAPDRPVGEVEHLLAKLLASQQAENTSAGLVARRRALSRNTLEVLELERRSISRALADDVGQHFGALQHAFDRGAPPAETTALFAALQESVTALQRELRPPGLDDLGLVSALRSYATREARRSGFELVLDLDDLDVDRELATACFRIAQEALANIVRHARASRVEVALQMISGKLDLVVRDDGVGFDPEAGQPGEGAHARFGLLAMTERAELVGGSLHITSAPDGGTTIRARL